MAGQPRQCRTQLIRVNSSLNRVALAYIRVGARSKVLRHVYSDRFVPSPRLLAKHVAACKADPAAILSELLGISSPDYNPYVPQCKEKKFGLC